MLQIESRMRIKPIPARNWAAIYTWILFAAAVVSGAPAGGFPSSLSLERAFPIDKRVEVSQLRERDRARHGRLLQSQNGVVDFPVSGTFDPYVVGLYYTTVRMGTPAQEFHVQIDTGSDVLWVSCTSCSGCPSSTNLPFNGLNFFDTSSSSSASTISCSDQQCSMGAQASDTLCNSQNNQCSYRFQYGDGSATSGYYVSDLLHFNTLTTSGTSSNTTSNSAKVVFGCSTAQSGSLSKSDRAVDGIFGFGQQSLSVISQLSTQGVAPQAFSHCLRGDSKGGGILVLGEIVEPGMVYAPLVPNMPHYNLYMESISVGNKTLAIDSSVFGTSTSNGTIIDSGTTLAYLAEAAYTPFADAINNAVSQSAPSVSSKGNGQCYLLTSSVDEVFPKVSLNFKGASMVLDPKEYLLQQSSLGGAEVWCIGIQNNQGQDMTILGDLVLQNKAVVYDLARQRIGWVDYDCSGTVNVTANSTGTNTFINTGQVSDNGSSRIGGVFILTFIMALFTSLL
ncbi:hypothetical protein V2J09_000036 [Rumex salicifolius]